MDISDQQGSTSRTSSERSAVDDTIVRALRALLKDQEESGEWRGDYGGPLFLLPVYIGTCYGTQTPIPSDVRAEMVRYMRNTQNVDGGWGLHVESHSYVFTSVLNYVALRLCDVPADDPILEPARSFIHGHGGPLAAASWGKFFLAVLNLFDYRGHSPLPPELWLLPQGLPVHPSRLWCQARMISLPMSYLYGKRLQLPLNPLIESLRKELYCEPYEDIDWESARERVAPCDAYTPLSGLAKAVGRALSIAELSPVKPLRGRALAAVLEQIAAEDRNSQYVCLNPISKLYHMWIWHHLRPDGPELAAHVRRLPEYLWAAADGTKVQGYHSSQLWDTAFAVRAMLATGEVTLSRDALERAHQFIDDNQVRADVPQRERCYRDPTKGGWGFSAKDNGWIVSDTTAEGLMAAMSVARFVSTPMPRERLREAVDYLLWSQTAEGGWASYEPTRGPRWLEKLNTSSVFGEIMIDYPYVECTSAALQSLVRYRQTYPGDRDREIATAVERGVSYLSAEQRSDGSFEGSWAICFTYGTWFGIAGLRAAGLAVEDQRIERACTFLERHQLPDGGWGETPESCRLRRYVHAESGQAVMTSWALLALLAGGRAHSESVSAGIRFLVARQNEDGTYPPEHIAGMFNKTCAIHYENYLKIFPLWALGEARRQRERREASP